MDGRNFHGWEKFSMDGRNLHGWEEFPWAAGTSIVSCHTSRSLGFFHLGR